jgi:hypothetical protein
MKKHVFPTPKKLIHAYICANSEDVFARYQRRTQEPSAYLKFAKANRHNSANLLELANPTNSTKGKGKFYEPL